MENDQKPALIPHKICVLNHHISPPLALAHLEQWYCTALREVVRPTGIALPSALVELARFY